jgi:hypothetical protein
MIGLSEQVRSNACFIFKMTKYGPHPDAMDIAILAPVLQLSKREATCYTVYSHYSPNSHSVVTN